MQHVAAHLRPGSMVLEYGGGGSTHWLASQVAAVVTIEHDAAWHARILENLPDNATVLLREPEPGGKIRSAVEQGTFDSYVAAIDTYPDQYFDLVVVDGRARVDCGLRAAPKVKAGGMLLLDDSQRRRYATLLQSLHRWKRIDFRGLKSKEVLISKTTVWHKPPSHDNAPI